MQEVMPPRALELGVSQGNPARIDGDSCKLVLLFAFGAKFLDVFSSCVFCFKFRMVDKAVDFTIFLLAVRL